MRTVLRARVGMCTGSAARLDLAAVQGVQAKAPKFSGQAQKIGADLIGGRLGDNALKLEVAVCCLNKGLEPGMALGSRSHFSASICALYGPHTSISLGSVRQSPVLRAARVAFMRENEGSRLN